MKLLKMEQKVTCRWRWVVLCATLLAFTWTTQVRGQQQLFTQHKFHRLDESHGLTNNVVNDILQDTLGQVWVATNEGLFRYQGFGFQQFIKGKGNTNFVHNNFIEQLYLDQHNNVWLMTDDGVGKYSYRSDAVQRFLPDKIEGRISSMEIDGDGFYYFGLYESGIIKVQGDSVIALDLYDKVSGTHFEEFSILNLEIDGSYLWALVSDIGVIRYDLMSGEIVYFSSRDISGREKLQQFDLYLDDDQRAWVSTEASVYVLEVDDKIHKKVDRELEKTLPPDDYLTIYKDENNQLWLGSRTQGMYHIKGDNGEYQVVRHFTRKVDQYGISSSTVSKIFKEENGYFWIGTHNGGLNVFHPEGELVRMVTNTQYDSNFSLSYENVWGICETDNGKIWVGTDGLGLSLLDPTTGYIQNNVIRELATKAILAAKEDSKGRLWLGTYADGVYLYDKSAQDVRWFNTTNSKLKVNDIRCFYEAKDGRVYIGTNQGGLYYFDEGPEQIKLLSGVSSLDIRAIAGKGNDFLWLGTFGKGLQKYSISKDRLVHSAWNENKSRASDVIFDIYQKNDTLWVATRHNAVLAFDESTERYLDLSGLDAINGRSVLGVEGDAVGNIWITMNTGVAAYNPATSVLKIFGADHGFQRGHFNFGSIIHARNGFMAMGGIHGMNLFCPKELLAKKTESDIVLNQLKIFNQIVNPLNSKVFSDDQSIFLTDKIVLDHTDNIFSIQFSLPGFTTQNEADFVYMLDGYEDKWQYGAESGRATYRNVPPGVYQFKVKNLESQRSLAIHINPPIWKTWQAYVVYFLLIAGLIWRLVKFNNSRIVLKQKLQFEQELREKEHAVMQEKLRFYTNFSHELKTPLTLIQGPVEDMLKIIRDPKHRQYLKLIRKNTDVLLTFIRRMLEFRKIEMSKTILNVGNHDLRVLAQEEAESFGYLAKERGVSLGFYCQNEIKAWVDLEKIQIVMNNLLSNAFKFTPKGKSINFGVYQKDSNLIIEVRDEGVGIKADELSAIFSPFFQASNSCSFGGTGIGLTLCKSLVELHLGEIQVKSKEGEGTAFLVTIPIDKAALEQKDYIRFIDVEPKSAEVPEANDDELDEHAIEAKTNEKVLLVVDDNKDILSYVKTLFSNEFNVLSADNGADAYELAIKNSPDIIISDMMMPGMDGFEFCRKIKANISTSHIPVIMLTAKDNKQDKINGYEIGADDYITKPFVSEVLIARVHNLLKTREMLELKYESNELIAQKNTANSREIEFVLKAEALILEMLEQSKFSVPQLCKELGMSQSALYRKIKSLTGVSIQVFIRKIRIKRAAELLVSSDMSVTEIAFSLEFSDLKYFRKCFKEQFNVTPSQYKTKYVKPSSQKIEVNAL